MYGSKSSLQHPVTASIGHNKAVDSLQVKYNGAAKFSNSERTMIVLILVLMSIGALQGNWGPTKLKCPVIPASTLLTYLLSLNSYSLTYVS